MSSNLVVRVLGVDTPSIVFDPNLDRSYVSDRWLICHAYQVNDANSFTVHCQCSAGSAAIYIVLEHRTVTCHDFVFGRDLRVLYSEVLAGGYPCGINCGACFFVKYLLYLAV